MNAVKDLLLFVEDIIVVCVAKFSAQNVVLIKYQEKLWDAPVRQYIF